jgi:hypothetical protein
MTDRTRTMGRREIIELFAGVAFLAACSGTSAKTRSENPASGTGYSSAPGSPDTFTLNGPSQPQSKRFTRAQLTRFRDQYAGTWTSAWVEDGGRRGTAEATIALDVVRRVGTYTVSFDGPLLGGASPKPTTYVVGVDQYDATSDHAVAVTRQLGRIEVTVEGFGQVRLRATDIPGHREISSVDIRAAIRNADAGNVTYTINKTDGTTQRGALAAAKGSARPAYPSLDQATDTTAFLSGDYAASLMTAEIAARLLGQPCRAPEPNGGKLQFAPGIDVSNARVLTVADNLTTGAVIQYSIYRAQDAAAMRTFFRRYVGYKPVPHVGEQAVALPVGAFPIGTLEVRKGRNNLDLSIPRGAQYKEPPAAQNDAMFVAVANAILAKLP